jgi:PAS domain S-box-containing protein
MYQVLIFSIIFIILFLIVCFILKKNYTNKIISLINTPFVIINKNCKFLFINESFIKLFGFSNKKQMLSKHTIFNKKELSDILNNLNKSTNKNEVFKIDCLKASGEKITLNFGIRKINNNYLMEIVDPNIHLGAEKKLRESQRLLSNLISNLPGIVYLSDANDVFMMKFVSDGCFELTGYEPIDLIDNNKVNFMNLIHEEDIKNVKDTILEAIKNNKSYHITYRIKSANKKEKWVWERGKPIFTSDREFLAIGGFISDITEYKMMEEKILEEKEKLAVTLRSIGDGVITTDTNGRVVLINKVAEKLTGWTQKEASGRQLTEVFNIINEKTRMPCKNPIEKVLEKGKIVGLANHTVLISKDGTERVIADSGAPIKDNLSRIIGVVLVFRDVTEKSRMEEEMNKILKLESLGILAGGIAHDFNNILTAILGNINLAKMYSRENKDLYELLLDAEKATYNSKKLTEQLLTFAKGGTPIKKAGSIKKVIEENLIFSLRGSNIKYEIDADDDVFMIDFDEGQMGQVFNNLIINSRQAMPNGGSIKVAIKNYNNEANNIPLLKHGNYIKITFEDTGYGISKENLPKIFDPFFSTKVDGKGLGLASVYSIVKKHDGIIQVDSKIKKGTKFTLYFPKTKDKNAQSADMANYKDIVRGKGRILIMDDELDIQNILRKSLQYLGYESDFTLNGVEAIKKYKKAMKRNEKYDCVLLDLTVPGNIGGKETIRELKKIDPDVNAIVMSGYSNDQIIGEYEKYGFKGAIIKPFKIEEISEELDKVLKNN